MPRVENPALAEAQAAAAAAADPPAPPPEVRLSPDGHAVAIRGENAEDSMKAWAYVDRRAGGGWLPTEDVADWTLLEVETP